MFCFDFFCCFIRSSVLFVIILPHALNSKLSKETNIQLGAKDSHNLLFWCIFEIVGGLLSLFMVVNHLLIVNYFRFFNLAWTVCDKLFKKCEHSRIYWVKWRRAHARGYGYGSFQFVVYLKLSSPQWTKLYQVRLPWFCRQKNELRKKPQRMLKSCSIRTNHMEANVFRNSVFPIHHRCLVFLPLNWYTFYGIKDHFWPFVYFAGSCRYVRSYNCTYRLWKRIGLMQALCCRHFGSIHIYSNVWLRKLGKQRASK